MTLVSSWWSKFAGLAWALTLSGCVPVFLATPPARVSYQASAQLAQASERAPDDGLSAVGDLRAGVYPLQLMDERGDRSLDIGLGYLRREGLGVRGGPLRHGAYLDVGLMRPFGDSRYVRWGARAQGGPVWDTASGGGAGGASQLLTFIELYQHVEERGEGDCDIEFCGFVSLFGEVAIGAGLGLGYERVGGRSAWTVGAELSVRIPTVIIVGVMLPGALLSADE